jgi:hypothetical protein
MEEQIHILDILIEKISEKIDKEVNVYLAMDDNDNELLAIKTKDQERGLDLAQIVNSYGFYRIYQADSEEEALEKLSENLVKSIGELLEDKVSKEN